MMCIPELLHFYPVVAMALAGERHVDDELLADRGRA